LPIEGDHEYKYVILNYDSEERLSDNIKEFCKGHNILFELKNVKVEFDNLSSCKL
jgi:hypothetical protein